MRTRTRLKKLLGQARLSDNGGRKHTNKAVRKWVAKYRKEAIPEDPMPMIVGDLDANGNIEQ